MLTLGLAGCRCGNDGPAVYTLSGAAGGWDTFAVPADCWRTLANPGADEALAILMTAGDQRKRIRWDDAVIASAADRNLVIDADGFVAPRGFVIRAQG